MHMTPAEQIALWTDTLRDLSATGLQYPQNVYDRDRYRAVQTLAIEMSALATGQDIESFEPLRATIFARLSPVSAGATAVIDLKGRLLLMRRTVTLRQS